MAQCVLIVDDDPVQRRILTAVISRFGYDTKTADGGEAALDILKGPEGGMITLVVLDLVMPGLDGMGVLENMRPDHSGIPVIVQTAHGSIDTVIAAMRAGAADFVVKPVSPERLEISIKNALKVHALEGEIKRIKKKSDGTLTFDDIVTNAPTMQKVIALGQRAAGSNIPILIEGESGVGKEMIARAIQGSSERIGKPLVTVNCGAIAENLVESILFGHEKGSFTGATSKHTGKFVEADGGTLFLDEVGELPPEAQVKLLRALQDGEVDPVGAKRSVKVDIRLISATNNDMIELVKEGKFREDLYYRLNVYPIGIPPLRRRMEDIPALVEHFITRFSAEEGKKIEKAAPDVLEMLQQYPWPGNVRQLENAVFRAVVLSDNPVLHVEEFPQIAAHVEGFNAEVPPAPAPAPAAPLPEGPAMIGGDTTQIPVRPAAHAGAASVVGIPVMTETGEIRPLEEVEADMIRLAIERYRGHMSEIARKLGIGRSTLYRKVRELGLEASA